MCDSTFKNITPIFLKKYSHSKFKHSMSAIEKVRYDCVYYKINNKAITTPIAIPNVLVLFKLKKFTSSKIKNTNNINPTMPEIMKNAKYSE